VRRAATGSGFERLYTVIRDHIGLNVSRLHPSVMRKLFLPRATVRRCDGRCCRGGTTVSLDERDRILSHAALVGEAITSRARRDPSRWFGRRITVDADFTTGRSTTTRVLDGACVFYRADGRCALQVAGAARLSSPYTLKPAVCLLWPLAVQDATLEVGYAWYTRRRECCAPVRGGQRTILQVISPDERLLRAMSRPENSRGGGPPSRSFRLGAHSEERCDLGREDRDEVDIPARVDRVDRTVRLQEDERRR